MQKYLARLFTLALLTLFLSGCNTTLPKHKIHHKVLGDQNYQQPEKVLLLPFDVAVYELTSGGQKEEVGTWTESARKHIDDALMNDSHSMSGFRFMRMPELTGEEQQAVDQHLSLFDVLAGNVIIYTRFPSAAWAHKTRKFDYTLGPGLNFLREKTGADTAFIIYAEDTISSSGRMATFIFAAAFGVAIPMGNSFMVGSLVDLKTGDILWIDYNVDLGSSTLREREDVTILMNSLLKQYPGTEAYKNLPE
ncbi:MAG: hypothetical protein ABW072_09225 [Sedimenticola sp.]